MSNGKGRRKTVRFVTAFTGLAGLAGATVTAAAPAQAGTDGQQLEVCNIHKPAELYVSGYNQHGSPVYYNHYVANGGCWTTTGWWWIGGVYASDYNVNTGSVYGANTATVPSNYPSNVYKMNA